MVDNKEEVKLRSREYIVDLSMEAMHAEICLCTFYFRLQMASGHRNAANEGQERKANDVFIVNRGRFGFGDG